MGRRSWAFWARVVCLSQPCCARRCSGSRMFFGAARGLGGQAMRWLAWAAAQGLYGRNYAALGRLRKVSIGWIGRDIL